MTKTTKAQRILLDSRMDAIDLLNKNRALFTSQKYNGYITRISNSFRVEKINRIIEELNIVKENYDNYGLQAREAYLKEIQRQINIRREQAIEEKRKAKAEEEKKEKMKQLYFKTTDKLLMEVMKGKLTKLDYKRETFQKYGITEEDIFKRVINLKLSTYSPNKFMNIKNSTGNYYRLTNNSASHLLKTVNETTNDTSGVNSDAEFLRESQGSDTLEITNTTPDLFMDDEEDNVRINRNNTGAFFPYYNNTTLDLSRYGIFKKNSVDYSNSCLLQALKNGGISDIKLNQIINIVNVRNIPMSKLKQICEEAKISIELHQYRISGNNKYITKYGNNDNEHYIIGIMCSHYFLIEDVKICKYAFEHYDDVKHLKDYQFINRCDNGVYKRNKDRTLNSFEIIKLMLDNKEKYLINIDYNDVLDSVYYKDLKPSIVNLEYDIDSCVKYFDNREQYNETNDYEVITHETEIPDEDTTDSFTNFFFDFETTTEGQHIPYLVNLRSNLNNDINKTFYGSDCGTQLLEFLSTLKIKNIQLIAHNCKYDSRFIMNKLISLKEILSGSRFISASGKYKAYNKDLINIKLKCSYHLMTAPLKSLTKSFNIKDDDGNELIKEIMPYILYTNENIKKQYININYVLDTYIEESDKEQFLNNLERWNLKRNEDYDIVKYSALYCEIDTLLLKKAYNKFKELCLCNPINLDIDNILTIGSLAHQYMIKNSVYDGVAQLSGTPQLFIQGCVVGGRVMSRNNKKIHVKNTTCKINFKDNSNVETFIIDDTIDDFDAVSLYPSAMARIKGFLLGAPKVLQNEQLNKIFLDSVDGYFIEVKILKVNKKLNMPLLSRINEKTGSRDFTNDMENQIIKVDNYALSDLIKYHDIEYEIIKGYYFNEGVNKNINKVITTLFNMRKEYKKIKNPIEQIFKLIMNSSYGKTITKAIETTTKYFNDKKSFYRYSERNYTKITEFCESYGKYKVVEIKELNKHYNMCQVGSQILSVSKNIMNEVICTAEDNNINIFYQDTDSMHLESKNVIKLSKLFTEIYGRELIGENLGQFHSDFDISGHKCEDVKSLEMVILGKKSYLDVLQGTLKNGDKVYGEHVRLKGIPNKTIEYTRKLNNLNSIKDLYYHLLKGKSVDFDLCHSDKSIEKFGRVNFDFKKNGTVETKTKFLRTVKF